MSIRTHGLMKIQGEHWKSITVNKVDRQLWVFKRTNTHRLDKRRKSTKSRHLYLKVILSSRQGSPRALSTIKMGTLSRPHGILPHDHLKNHCFRMLVIDLAFLTQDSKKLRLDKERASSKETDKLNNQQRLLPSNLQSVR